MVAIPIRFTSAPQSATLSSLALSDDLDGFVDGFAIDCAHMTAQVYG